MGFPKDFIWGAAAASYQIEGGAYDDGKGLSVWDTFCMQSGNILNSDTGDVAIDHYHRYKDDVQLMKNIGLPSYRLSISWPRVIPDGIGSVNQKGLDFYDRLIDELLEKDIIPYVTLFHWDYPNALQLKGGWLNDDSPEWFAEYTQLITRRLSDRVKNWFTLNEPQCFVALGHRDGIHAPGLRLSDRDILKVYHNSLLAHGKAVKAIRENAVLEPFIGIALVGNSPMPVTNSDEDIAYARKKLFDVSEFEPWTYGFWMDPIFLGEYPRKVHEYLERHGLRVTSEEQRIISEEVDFLGLNIYTGYDVSGAKGRHQMHGGYPRTSNEWRVTPKSVYWGSRFAYERYKKPIIISENGMANNDWPQLDGRVMDYQRIDYIQRYLRELSKAIDEGVDIKGYFYWSIFDNFEWAKGYRDRFGLVYVDMETQERILKESAYWYKKVIDTNGERIF